MGGLDKGKYRLDVYKVGYKVNDSHTAYIEMGRPAQLSKKQVEDLKKKSNGVPVASETVTIKKDGTFTKDFDLRENDVYFIDLVRLH